jgi:hypothetical protein
VASRFEGSGIELSAPGRSLLGEGQLSQKIENTSKCRRYHVFLFNDLLIFAMKKSDRSLLFHRLLPLENIVQLQALATNPRVLFLQLRSSPSGGATTAQEEALVLSASSTNKRDWWVEQISKAMTVWTEGRNK